MQTKYKQILLVTATVIHMTFNLNGAQATHNPTEQTEQKTEAAIQNFGKTFNARERKKKVERRQDVTAKQALCHKGCTSEKCKATFCKTIVLDYYHTHPLVQCFKLIDNDTNACLVIEQVKTFPYIFSCVLPNGTTGYHACSDKCNSKKRHHPSQPTPNEGVLIKNARQLAAKASLNNPGCFSIWQSDLQGNFKRITSSKNDHEAAIAALESELIKEQALAQAQPARPATPKNAARSIRIFAHTPPQSPKPAPKGGVLAWLLSPGI